MKCNKIILRYLPIPTLIVVYLVIVTIDFSDSEPELLSRGPVPEFSLTGPSQSIGGVTSDDLRRGRISVVNFFASWCGPCLREHRYIMRLSQESDVAIYGISFHDKAEDSVNWLYQLGNPYLGVGHDPMGRTGRKWAVAAIPVTFIVDGDGFIRYRIDGPINDELLTRTIIPVIQQLNRTDKKVSSLDTSLPE